MYSTLIIAISALVANPAKSLATGNVTYNIEITPDRATGERTRNGKSVKFSFPVEDESGLILINRRILAKHSGDEDWAKTHPFSFADPQLTSVTVKAPKDYFLFSSFRELNGKLTEKSVSQFVVVAAKKDLWTRHQFEFEGANFELIIPKANSQIEPAHWEKSLRSIWKRFVDRFGKPTDHIVFVDLEGPISGGPLGEDVLGIFATKKMNSEFQDDMKANLGWEPKASTKAYVEAYYPKSSNRWEEYLLGTFSHEIGHLFFGFGLTRERVQNANDLWFSLGLGMLYDMEITKQLTGNEPQLELDIIKSWKERYAKLTDVDQRLVNPDKSNDKKYPFDRKKVFAHGKAAHYLMAVRAKIGAKAFDEAVLSYLQKCRECTNGYNDFKKFLPGHTETLDRLEKEHQVI